MHQIPYFCMCPSGLDESLHVPGCPSGLVRSWPGLCPRWVSPCVCVPQSWFSPGQMFVLDESLHVSVCVPQGLFSPGQVFVLDESLSMCFCVPQSWFSPGQVFVLDESLHVCVCPSGLVQSRPGVCPGWESPCVCVSLRAGSVPARCLS